LGEPRPEAEAQPTPEEARAVRDRLGPPARLAAIDGAGHGGLWAADPERYRAEAARLLEEAAAPR
jgi:hypothetical protein